MNFSEFLKQAPKACFWQESNKYCFHLNSSSPLFFQLLIRKLESNKILPYERLKLDLDLVDQKNLFATLSQSVLGDVNFFWLGEQDLDSKDKKTKGLISYILDYQGPHFIAFSTTSDLSKIDLKNGTIIKIENMINYENFEKISFFFNVQLSDPKINLIKTFFKHVKSVQLDSACMLLNYIELINIKYANEYLQYLLALYGEAPSLNALSELFFAKKTTEFFGLWSKIYDDYTDIFWLAFWGDQIWRASNFIKNIENKNFIEAKRVSSRLPFSFVNTHWKMYKNQDLIKSYDFLYLIDYKIKRGSQFCVIDLFYLKQFQGKLA